MKIQQKGAKNRICEERNKNHTGIAYHLKKKIFLYKINQRKSCSIVSIDFPLVSFTKRKTKRAPALHTPPKMNDPPESPISDSIMIGKMIDIKITASQLDMVHIPAPFSGRISELYTQTHVSRVIAKQKIYIINIITNPIKALLSQRIAIKKRHNAQLICPKRIKGLLPKRSITVEQSKLPISSETPRIVVNMVAILCSQTRRKIELE
jgi:hypothetical protein